MHSFLKVDITVTRQCSPGLGRWDERDSRGGELVLLPLLGEPWD